MLEKMYILLEFVILKEFTMEMKSAILKTLYGRGFKVPVKKPKSLCRGEWLGNVLVLITNPINNPSKHYGYFRKAVACIGLKLEPCRQCRFSGRGHFEDSSRIQVLAHMPC